MKIPLSTYRIQFNPTFGFKETKKIVPYLKELGITTIYGSPIQQSRTDSQHGYDMIDFNRIDTQLGGEKRFRQLIQQIKNRQMSWIQDIVPNHMAYHPTNPFIYDILKNGNKSTYCDYFDMDWQHKDKKLHGKLLFPFLEKPLEDCIQEGLMQLSYEDGKFLVNYHNFSLPLKQDNIQEIISIYINLMPVEELTALPVKNPAKLLWLLDKVNKNSSQLSYQFWQRLLMAQNYLPAYWKDSRKEINYRRFFSINELICLKMEKKDVFDSVHQLILKEVRQGNITGLRIDHLDGLFNPRQYLKRLRKEVADTYTVVEKILQPEEMLPVSFSAEGNTGYDFLYYLNNLFCQKKNGRKFFNIYHSFINKQYNPRRLAQQLVKKKRLILKQQMYGDLRNITNFFYDHYQQYIKQSSFVINWEKLLKALQEIMIRLSCYRTYISQSIVKKKEINQLLQIINYIKQVNPELNVELQFISTLLINLLNKRLNESEKKSAIWLVMRLQQFTGPLMAKGMEDTLLYCYHPLLSLNEVGGEPGIFGINKNKFYTFLKKKEQKWPYSMNASTTHDTKRGEDIRARINVLSEIPEYWQKKLAYWHQLNLSKKVKEKSLLFPDNNMEYFLYQTLIGTFPFSGLIGINGIYIKRIQQYMIKSAREAKIYTNWLNPYQTYETILTSFVVDILKNKNNTFLNDVYDFQRFISYYGLLNSLSQVVLKFTCPGIPDFYQGSELWDLRLVDPDNRRPVDYNYRINSLQDIKTSVRNSKNTINLLRELLSKPENGKIKLFIIYQLLQLRNRESELFLKGSFVPLSIKGKYKDNIIAYLRAYKNKTLITIVPRFCTKLVKSGQYPLGNNIWKNTFIELPKKETHPGLEWVSQQYVRLDELTPAGNILKYFPVAVILADKEN
ncbi:MAG: malto-oligosyltrehalose synthase [Atribacterota bacterium]